MKILEVEGLVKHYPGFTLDQVGFGVEEGRICGLVGKNGAGKTTTLKSMVNLVRPEAGRVRFFGLDFPAQEFEVKRQIGIVFGGVSFYPEKQLRTISAVAKGFHGNWDDHTYRRLMERFGLDDHKTPSALSEGMKVKYSLVLALSHQARFLILDEPTSGLDPVSRDELLELFLALQDEGKTILFSTHITSDLERCAQDLVYIQNGQVRYAGEMEGFLDSWRLVETSGGPPPAAPGAGGSPKILGISRTKEGWRGLVATADLAATGLEGHKPDLQAIMVHLEKEAEQ